MDWEEVLTGIYCMLSDNYSEGLKWHSRRYSNNTNWLQLSFSDEELLSVYLYGLIRKYRSVKQIYTYTKDHLLSWFPGLPSYQKFNARLNRLVPSLYYLVHALMSTIQLPAWLDHGQQLVDAIVDSMPIIMAQGPRSDSARVAKCIADKSYCASKKTWFYGLRLHLLAICLPTTMPKPVHFELSAATGNDNTIFKEQIAPRYRNLRVFADKIYGDEGARQDLWNFYRIQVMACQKRKIKQKYLKADQKLMNTMISQQRQPIESFFNWLEHHTAIQRASKVRSIKGLFKHLFGRLAAALIILLF